MVVEPLLSEGEPDEEPERVPFTTTYTVKTVLWVKLRLKIVGHKPDCTPLKRDYYEDKYYSEVLGFDPKTESKKKQRRDLKYMR